MGEPLIGITGAEGQIGTILRRELGSRYRLRAFTLQAQGFDSRVLDLTDATQVEGAFDGLDALVHLAAESDPKAPWSSVREKNVEMTFNVLEECNRAGVKRVVFASTHHTQNATTMFEHRPGSFDPARAEPKSLESLPDPDSLYAVSKLFGEMLGRLYSVRFGLSFIALRIGWVTLEERPDRFVGGPTESYLRAYFLGQRDCAAAFEAALRSTERYLVAYAISRNPSCPFDLDSSNRRLGFEPVESVDGVLRRLAQATGPRGS